MGGGGKIALGILIAAAVVPIGIAAYFAPRDEKSYHFPEVTIDATVHHDGTLELHERRTFAFRGDFSFAFFSIAPTHAPPSNIEGFTIAENGQPAELLTYVNAEGGFEARWDFAASDERRTWDISYRVRCAVDVYADAAHLLWQFVGTGWTEPSDHVLVALHLPGRPKRAFDRPAFCPSPEAPAAPKAPSPLARGDVKAWGHGPFAGEVRIPDPQTVTLEVRDLRPSTFVEGSILFPAEAVPGMALQPGGPGRDRIVAEEARLARGANDLRAAHRRETVMVKVLFGLVPALMLGLFLWARRRDRVAEVPRILQEPPEPTHPAKLALMWGAYRKRFGAREAYRAQFLHLVQEGALELEAVGRVTDPEEILLRRRDSQTDGHDREFLGFLFLDGERPALDGIRAKGERKERLGDWWEALGKQAKRDVKKISKGRSRIETNLMAALGIGAGVYGLWRWTGFEEGFEPLGLVGPLAAWLIPVGVVSWALLSRLSRPWLPPGLRRRMAGWAAFRRFLREFSTLDDAPALAVTVWERYLVYAVALGVADEVERQVKALVPAERLAQLAPDNVPDGYHHWSSRVTHQSAPVASGGASAVGYSSGWGGTSGVGGGGGGFSGGGGGGGGGTGGGAG